MSKTKILLGLLFAAWSAFGQSDRGTITGTIADPAGAVVAAVPVEVKNVETGGLYEAASTATGNYTVAQLPVGTYTMTVVAPGFKRFVQENIRVQVAQVIRIDVALEVGSAAESITVTDEVSLLKTESGEMSHTVSAKRLNELPILGIGGGNSSSQGMRYYLSQTQLLPGVYFSTGANGIRVNGAPNNTLRIQVDGMDSTNALIPFSHPSMQPSVDAVEETSVQTSNFAAEYGQVGGGLYNVTMKSGTNQYHGGGFNYMANEAMNAATPYVNTKPRIRRNDFGFTFGGAVKIPKVYNGANRSFFFLSFEQYREFFQTNDRAITVPTTAYRAGDFTTAWTARNLAGTDPLGRTMREGTIFDPATTRPSADGRLFRDPFLNNVIPVARLDRVALKVQSLIPTPTSSAVTSNYLPSFPNDRVTSNPSFKIDQQMGSKAKLSFYFGSNRTKAQYSQQLNGSEGLPEEITSTRGTFTKSWTYRLNLDYTLSPSLLLHMGSGLVLYKFSDASPTRTYDSVTALGLVGATVRGEAGGRFPSITGLCQGGASPTCTGTGGMANMGPGAGGNQSNQSMTTPTGNITLTWVKDNHTYKFGSEVRPQGFVGHILNSTNGNYAFSAAQTGQPYLQATAVGGISVGFPYASFLLGSVGSGSLAYPSDVRTGKDQWSFYGQDTWKIRRNLTLDYGLRWDYATTPTEQYGRLPSLDAGLANPTAGGHPGATVFEATCNCQFGKNYKGAVQPRIGLAYQINQKTVLRAGFGLAYNTTGSAGFGNAAHNNPFTAPAFGIEAMTLQTGVPATFLTPWPNFSPGVFPAAGNPGALAGPPSVIDQNAGRPPRQYQWSIGLQRELFRNLVVEASYVGNRGIWWPSTQLNYNALEDSRLAAYGLSRNNAADLAILRAPLNSAAAARFQNRLPYGSFPATATVAQSLRPFPQFASGLTPTWAPVGNTWYDSLQVKVTKRLSQGLDFSYNFTWAKELQRGTDGPTNDVFNRAINKTFTGFSRPLVSVLAVNYRVPTLSTYKPVSWVLRDWTLGTVLQYASGFPIAAPTSNNRMGTVNFQGNTYFNRVAGQPLFLKDLNCHCVDPRKDLVLNPAAWTDAADGQFSTSAAFYNDYRQQRRPSESLSLARTFRFAERFNLMLRGEFSNVFNRTQMTNASSTNAAAATTTSNGVLTGGFGFINPATVDSPPRQGTIVARLSF